MRSLREEESKIGERIMRRIVRGSDHLANLFTDQVNNVACTGHLTKLVAVRVLACPFGPANCFRSTTASMISPLPNLQSRKTAMFI